MRIHPVLRYSAAALAGAAAVVVPALLASDERDTGAGNSKCPSPPTVAEVRQVFEAGNRAYYAENGAGTVAFEWLSPIAIGQLEEQGPAPVRLQFPVRGRVRTIVTYPNGKVEHADVGWGAPQEPDNWAKINNEPPKTRPPSSLVWLFYRNGFNEWEYKSREGNSGLAVLKPGCA